MGKLINGSIPLNGSGIGLILSMNLFSGTINRPHGSLNFDNLESPKTRVLEKIALRGYHDIDVRVLDW